MSKLNDMAKALAYSIAEAPLHSTAACQMHCGPRPLVALQAVQAANDSLRHVFTTMLSSRQPTTTDSPAILCHPQHSRHCRAAECCPALSAELCRGATCCSPGGHGHGFKPPQAKQVRKPAVPKQHRCRCCLQKHCRHQGHR